ncbi:MAG: hypothetical protein BAJALOKI3v1_210050 [Promethearchaeota archaeon]|nr:MAG: hypothetical protein BAJALOKI3v1_210050 [Candidatus Lokiarchaeota archaeon]
MSSASNQKSIIQAINAYMLTALLSIFAAGIILILFVFLFGIQVFSINEGSNLYIGLFLIAIGVIQSIRLMKNMKKISDVVLSRKEIALESTAQQPTGTGRGLNIIRPTMSESTPRTKPLPTSTKTQKPIQKKPEKEVEPISATKKEESAKEPEISEESESKAEEELEITLEEALQKIVDRYNDPKVSSSFSKWDDTLMMTFPNIDTSYLYKINRDQGIELVKGYEEDAAVQVNIDSDVFIKMMTKQINPIKAYSSGKLEVVGKMRSLLKLRKLMF